MIFVLNSVKNIVGKGENAGYQHFLLFSECFQKAFYSGSIKVGLVWERVKSIIVICSLHNETKMNWSKIKAIADNFNVAPMMKFVFYGLENGDLLFKSHFDRAGLRKKIM